MSDYYEILGVKKDASEAELKSAYRKKAREHHPDVAKNKEEAEKKFKEINEAYQVLGNPQKRAQYDQFGASGVGGNGPGQAGAQGGFGGQNGYTYTWNSSQGGQNPFGNGFDPFDIFEEVFGFRDYGRRAPQKGKNLFYALRISFVDAVKGVTKKLKVGNEEFDVKIPAGVNTGTELKITGKGGEAPSKGLPRGDLFLSLEVEHPDFFERHGEDIYSIQEIKLTQATLGDKIRVKTVDPKSSNGMGEVTVKIHEGTQSGTTFRVRGSGMPSLRGSGRGDHYVKVKVEIPSSLSKKQKQLLEELSKEGL